MFLRGFRKIAAVVFFDSIINPQIAQITQIERKKSAREASARSADYVFKQIWRGKCLIETESAFSGENDASIYLINL
jgi:hypothetical protein